MLAALRLQEAKDMRNGFKVNLHYNSNIYMIKYYHKFIYRLDKLIQRNKQDF